MEQPFAGVDAQSEASLEPLVGVERGRGTPEALWSG
jgi:hypothetical protein